MKILFLFLFSFFFLAPPVPWENDFTKAKELSKQEKKCLLLYFTGSDWSSPSIKMEKLLFESDEFQNYAATNLILAYADFPHLKDNQLEGYLNRQNRKLAEKYNPNGYLPYTVLLDNNDRILKTWYGLPKISPDNFVKQLNDAIDVYR